MNGPFSNEYCKSACTELENLEDMVDWGSGDCYNDMNVIISTWDFRLNRYPDRLIKKFESIFCACRDMHLKGIYFFETYMPVFQCTPVCLMLILKVLLQFKSI